LCKLYLRRWARGLQAGSIGLLTMLCWGGLPAGALAQQAPEFFGNEQTPAPQNEDPVVAYETALLGIEDEGLRAVLEASSQLFALAQRPPATLVGLRRRAEGDLERLRTALRSEGYYASQLDLEIDSDAQPVRVGLNVDPGPRYALVAYEISYVESPAPPETEQPNLEEIAVSIGMPARAPEIVAAEQSLISRLQQRGHPFARIAERKTFVNHEDRAMTVQLSVDAGPAATFGPLTFTGQQRVAEPYLRRVAGWREGAPYDRRILQETQRRLSATGLFSSVTAETPAAPDADGALPVTVTVVEREHRSIGAAASISTDIGPGAEVFWEHRNLLGENETFRVSATGSLIEQSGTLNFRKPAFLDREQDFLAELTGGFEDNDAFERQAVEGLVALERPFLENWRISGGVSAGYEIVDENADNNTGEREFTLFGLPLTATRDTTDDPLDPASGTRLQTSLTPATGFGDESLLFVTGVLGGSAYYAVDEDERFVLAGRARAGTILGEKTEVLPADRRFFAGGGGSIRGYEFQLVGPLDDDEDPLGGTSLVELGVEARVRVSEDIGVVPFLDGGTVFDDPWFNSGETLRWAAGLGVRYFTGFGPLRLDVAFPLNGRDDVDETLQLYISFGQAF